MKDPLDELYALWAEIFGEPPSIAADADLLYSLLFRYLAPAPPYGTFNVPAPAAAEASSASAPDLEDAEAKTRSVPSQPPPRHRQVRDEALQDGLA